MQEQATPPAFAAFDGPRMMPLFNMYSIASFEEDMFEPSQTYLAPLATIALASSINISF